jgi:hypothetical protein
MWSVLPATAVRLPARCRRPRPVACDRLAPHSRRRTSQGAGARRVPDIYGGIQPRVNVRSSIPRVQAKSLEQECPIRLATNLLGRSCRGGSRAERPADRCPEQLPNCA